MGLIDRFETKDEIFWDFITFSKTRKGRSETGTIGDK